MYDVLAGRKYNYTCTLPSENQTLLNDDKPTSIIVTGLEGERKKKVLEQKGTIETVKH